MKSHRRSSFASFSATTTFTYALHSDTTAIPRQSTEIPIESPPPPPTIVSQHSDAATRIQSSYRSRRIRTLYREILSVNRDADHLQSLIQQQETVDAIRSDDLERRRMEESLMALLLRLDSVPGLDPAIREARRKVSRRIVGMQEILDSVVGAKGSYGFCGVGDYHDIGGYLYGWVTQGKYWEEAVEEEMCRDKGGEEMDRFCAEYLGFRCFQRFLRE